MHTIWLVSLYMMYTFGCCSLSCRVGTKFLISVHIFSLFSFFPPFFHSQNEESNVSLLFVWFASVFSRLPWASLMTPPSFFFFFSFFFLFSTSRIGNGTKSWGFFLIERLLKSSVKSMLTHLQTRNPSERTEAGCNFSFKLLLFGGWCPPFSFKLSILFYLLFTCCVRAVGEKVTLFQCCTHVSTSFWCYYFIPLTCRDDRYIFTEITVKCFIVTCHEIINPLVEMTSLFPHFSCVIF